MTTGGMSILKANHYYRLKEGSRKLSRHIPEICPVADLVVSSAMADEYDDVSGRTIGVLPDAAMNGREECVDYK